MEENMKRSLRISKRRIITIGLCRDNKECVEYNIPLTPYLELGFRDEDDKIYYKAGFSLSINWLGWFLGFSYVNEK